MTEVYLKTQRTQNFRKNRKTVGGNTTKPPAALKTLTPQRLMTAETAKVAKDLNSLSHRLIGIAIDIHKNLGPGFQERIYEEALLKELEKAGIAFYYLFFYIPTSSTPITTQITQVKAKVKKHGVQFV